MIVRPPRLRAGDLVAIVAPAGCIVREGVLASGVAFLESFGLRVRIGRSVTEDPGYLGRDVRLRGDDVMAQLRDPDVRALVTLAGGSTSAEILPLVDASALARDPKIVLGFSDPTVLLCALHEATGVVTFSGENLLYGYSRRAPESAAEFSRVLMRGGPLGELAPWGPRQAWRDGAGAARGRLVAGNLFSLRTLLGTRWWPSLRGAVLAWEEVKEDLEDLNVMLTHFVLTGALDGVAAMIVGHLEQVGPAEHGLDERKVVLRACAGDYPVLKTVDFGHYRPSAILPIGVEVEVDAARERIVFPGAAVE